MKTIINTFGSDREAHRQLNERAHALATQAGFDYRWTPAQGNPQQTIADALQQADIVLIDTVPVGENAFAPIRGKNKLLVTLSAGYEHIDLAAATRHGVAVANTPGANAIGVAEMALTLMLGCRRLLLQNDRFVRNNGDWAQQDLPPETIGCATVGLVGFGAIGQAFARMLVALGCRLLVYARRHDESLAREIGIEYVSLEELFRTADAVSVHVAYSQDTHHLVNRELMSLMKPTAVLVNTARGKIVDEKALIQFLTERRIAAAGLDVFEHEPLPPHSPLMSLDNVILAPHAGSNTMDSTWRVFEKAITIAGRFFAGEGDGLLLNPDYQSGQDV